MSASTYVIRPRPPFRALVISAVLSLLGALLLVLGLALSWHIVVAVLGGVLLSAGVALFIAAVVVMRRRVVVLTLDAQGYTVVGAGQDHKGTWKKVTRVTQNEAGDRLTIHESEQRTYLYFMTPDGELIEAVAKELRRRLRASR